ncbi:hypothetical protein ACJMK2_014128 [Sinanodonta woodiana]|uniref:Peptidase C45 hydrolase domain-containing protein n=1 Tax=Sinanodonta woodiana TaxID=1069815 RepID=A0ABD3V059_SINWO
MAQTLPMLFTRGTHYEVGHSIGSVFREQIQKYFSSSNIVQSCLLPFYNTNKGRDIFAEYRKAAEICFPQYVTEIQGMSDGSGMSFENLFLLNMAKEIQIVHYAEVKHEIHGCSTILLNTPDMKIMAHNEDCDPMISPYRYVVNATVIDPEAKTGTVSNMEEQFTSFSYPGMLPGYAFGYNKHGIVFTINAIHPVKASVGSPPVGLISRAFLSASTVDEVIRLACNEGHGSADAFNVNVASLNHKEMWSVEVGPGKPESPFKVTTITEQVDQDKPCHYYHFNQYQHLEGIEQNLSSPSTPARFKRVEKITPPRTIKDVKAILGDTENNKLPIFRRPNDVDLSMTACTVVFDILQQWMEIYVENPNMGNAPLLKLPLTF